MVEFKRTHKGLMFNMIPVWVDLTDYECPIVQGRNIFFDILIDVVTPLFGICIFIMTAINRDYAPAWPIKLTGEYDGHRN